MDQIRRVMTRRRQFTNHGQVKFLLLLVMIISASALSPPPSTTAPPFATPSSLSSRTVSSQFKAPGKRDQEEFVPSRRDPTAESFSPTPPLITSTPRWEPGFESSSPTARDDPPDTKATKTTNGGGKGESEDQLGSSSSHLIGTRRRSSPSSYSSYYPPADKAEDRSSGYGDDHGHGGGYGDDHGYGSYKVPTKPPGPFGPPKPNFKCERTTETLYVTKSKLTYDKKCFTVYKVKCQAGYDTGKAGIVAKN